MCSLLIEHHLNDENDKLPIESINEMLSQLNFTEKDSKSVIALLSFIIVNSVKNCILSEVLDREMMDLGIPKENCKSIVKVYTEHFSL